MGPELSPMWYFPMPTQIDNSSIDIPSTVQRKYCGYFSRISGILPMEPER